MRVSCNHRTFRQLTAQRKSMSKIRHFMKSRNSLSHLLIAAVSSLLAISSLCAQTTYTWTQKAAGTYDWTDGANWDGAGSFVSDSDNELRFFVDTSLDVPTGTKTITNVPSTLLMKTLTLNGGSANTTGQVITFGDGTSTWTIGDGSTATINLNANNWTFENQSIFYTLPNIVLNAPNVTITGSGDNNGNIFAGNITEAASGYGFTKSGTSQMIVSGNNTYTGTTAVNGGLVRLNSANALPGGIGVSGGTSALTLNGGVVELGVGDFKRNLGTGSDQFRIIGGISGFSAYGGSRVVSVNGDASQELQWGSTHFAPSTLVLNSGFANNSIELANKIDLNGTSRTVQVGANYALISGDIRTATGFAGMTKTGAGKLILTGNNTYNGGTTISAGALSISSVNNIGGSGVSDLSMNGGTLQISGTALTSLSDLDSTVTFSNTAKGFDIQSASNTFAVDQVISGTGTGSTLTKSGAGTLVLNKNNTFAGATTVTGGGTLVLDYSDSINGNGSKLSDTAALTLSGGAIVLKGGTHTELVASTTLSANTASSISRDSISPGSAKISLGALTISNLSSLSISEANLATTTTANNASGILNLGRVTAGSDFGANDGSGNIVAYAGYTNYTPATATTGSNSVVNQLTGGGTLANSLLSYSLRIANSGTGDVLELGSRNLTVINNGTFLYAGGGDNNYTINGTGSIGSASGNQAFTINTYNGTTLTVNAKVSGNVAPVLKAGAGTLVLGGNSAAGAIYVQEGVLRVANNDGLGNTTNGTNVNGGAALEIANNVTIGAETLSINGAGISNNGALRNHSGNNTFAGAITIGASGARINADASTSLTLTGGITTTLTQDVTFGGAGNNTVSTTAISGSGSVIKDGAGILTLSATNTYTGATTVSNGTLVVNGNISNSRHTTVASGASIGGSGTIGALTVSSGGFINPGNSPGILNTGNYVQAGTYNAEITGLTPGVTGHDQINVTGTVDITSGSLTALFSAGTYAANDLIFILLNEGTDAITGTYTGLAQGTTVTSYGGFDWQISYTANNTGVGTGTFTGGNDIALMAVIPEPGTALLGALGVLLLLRRRR
jgi:fibronectin-binding autotransporter adhesin